MYALCTWCTSGELRNCWTTVSLLVVANNEVGSRETEIGVSEARRSFFDLLSRVESGDGPIFLTKNGRRIAALAEVGQQGSRVAHSEPADHYAAPPPNLSIPGDLSAAITFVEASMTHDEQRAPGISRYRGSSLNELAGGFVSLAYFLIPTADEVSSLNDDKRVEYRRLPFQLFESSMEIFGMSPAVAPQIIGTLVAAATENPAHWRNSLGVPLTVEEVAAWFAVCHVLAMLWNSKMGDG